MAGCDDFDQNQANREKGRVAISSMLAAIMLTAFKLIVGIATNSLGILSEAAHSALDLLATGMTLWAVKISGRPADREYTYGHGKFENLSALVETMLLLATCLWIVYEATARFVFHRQFDVKANVWAFLVVLFSMVVDFSRSRALHHYAQKYNSRALEADALNFSTDIGRQPWCCWGWSECSVAQKVHLPWLTHADTVAALGVAVIVIFVSVRLGKKSVDDLLDRIPAGLSRAGCGRGGGRAGGYRGHQNPALRRSGPETFADVTLSVGLATSFEKAHQISDEAAAAVRSILPAPTWSFMPSRSATRRGTDDDGPRVGGAARDGRPRHPHFRRTGATLPRNASGGQRPAQCGRGPSPSH